MNPTKQKYLQGKIHYLLDNDFIEPSQSEWSSPCILVPKPDGSYRMCIDYKRVNILSKTDTFPIPRVDDCTDKIGKSKYVTKFDILKPTNPNMHKSNKRTKSTKISTRFPKRGNRNAERTEKHKKQNGTR